MKDITIPLALINILVDGEFHSNEQLSKNLKISQLRVNKYVKILRDWGLEVFNISEKGYKFPESIHLLDKNIIHNQIKDGKIIILPVIDSTNNYFLNRINELNSGDICIAEYQKAGRGRRGRQWFSPFGVNLYFSIFWRFKKGFATITGLNLVTSIVIAEVLQRFGISNVRIKWPNDLYLYGRKVAGILTELRREVEEEIQVVIGIGINIAMHNVRADIINQAWIALQEAGILLDRNILMVYLIKELRNSLMFFEQEGISSFLSRWERFDDFINRPIKLIIGDNEICGISRGINAQGALMLEQNDGIVNPWVSGDISLRNAE